MNLVRKFFRFRGLNYRAAVTLALSFISLTAISAHAEILSKKSAATPAKIKAAPLKSDAQHLANRGFTAFANGDLDSAKKDFLKLLKLAPENPVALANLGSIEIRQSHFAKAENYLKRALHQQPEAAPVWLTLGELYFTEDKIDAALAALSQAVLYDPKSAAAHNYLGITISKKGWLMGAEDELRKAVSLKPDYAEAQFNLALMYLQQHPPAIELARLHYEKAIKLGEKSDPQVEKTLAASKQVKSKNKSAKQSNP